jgi:hypothetical protein
LNELIQALAANFMFDVVVRLAILLVTGFLFCIMIISYGRMRSLKLLLILIGFGVLFLHSILLMPEIMIENYTMGFTDTFHLLIHLTAMSFITLGIIKD